MDRIRILDTSGSKRDELRSQKFDLTLNTVTNLFYDSVSVSIRVTAYEKANNMKRLVTSKRYDVLPCTIH